MLFSQQPYLTSSKTKEATNYVPSYFARHHRRRRHRRRRKRSERTAFDFGFDSLASHSASRRRFTTRFANNSPEK